MLAKTTWFWLFQGTQISLYIGYVKVRQLNSAVVTSKPFKTLQLQVMNIELKPG